MAAEVCSAVVSSTVCMDTAMSPPSGQSRPCAAMVVEGYAVANKDRRGYFNHFRKKKMLLEKLVWMT
jgi:hypothetical protein